ncbi:MAG: response regulator [Phycisphaerales bacterium]|nr:response regulator [Phycisphaerales bacterium]
MDTLRVLVTDDEAEMRRAVDRALARFTVALPDVEGEVCFAVEQAESGEQALEKIAVQPPDILMLDYKMGGMTGLDVLDQLSKQEHEMLTVMVTAYASLETAVVATKRGAFDFIAKPFTPAELKDTVRKAAAHLLMQRQARKLAQEKRQVRFQFISVLAHELKAPLGAIEGFLQALTNPQVRANDEACAQMIGRCLIRTEGMRKMIHDLLDLTRIESGAKKRELAELDVVEMVHRSIETLTPLATERNVRIEVRTDGPIPMMADQGEIEIIANNLLSNAVKYNKEGGRVEVKLSADGEEAVLAVTDTGIGMTAEETARLFRDFVRIKNDQTRRIMGSGLGLSIVKKLALLYGGDATVWSEPGEGSTFTVRLKRNLGGEPAAAAERAVEA